ncbi:MoxR family ATPase [Candidatus Woesearchaeota archaeon]|nr:MoxR family ATPase [Candidatus Woesearchaeota archaeon]
MMKVADAKKLIDKSFSEVGRVIVGQEEMVGEVMIALLCNAHALLEGYPGLAKTLVVKTMAEMMELKFSRIQNTPDLMPSDITGTYLIEETTGGKRNFKFQPGPVFANLVLADEINRATPKTQSALLEAMQERQVTVGNTTYQLDKPFFVLATQNPIEQEGTYPLPEAQSDRFLLKINVSYPTFQEELEIVNRYAEQAEEAKVRVVLKKAELLQLQQLSKSIPIANDIKKYAVDIVTKTRNSPQLIEYGASPRASLGLVISAKARALLNGRKYVSKDDVKNMALPILRHRIIPTFEAEKSNLKVDDVIKKIL